MNRRDIAPWIVAAFVLGVSTGYGWHMKATEGRCIRIVVRHVVHGDVANVVDIDPASKTVALSNGETWRVNEFFEAWRGLAPKEAGNGKRK